MWIRRQARSQRQQVGLMYSELLSQSSSRERACSGVAKHSRFELERLSIEKKSELHFLNPDLSTPRKEKTRSVPLFLFSPISSSRVAIVYKEFFSKNLQVLHNMKKELRGFVFF